MADALLDRLTSVVTPSVLSDVGAQLGVPEDTISRGLALSSATVVGAMANRSGDTGAMRQIIDVASHIPSDMIQHGVSTGQLTEPGSSMLCSARVFVASLFGETPTWAVDLIGRETRLRTAAATSMLALGAHAVLNVIGRRVRDEGMTASSLASFLNVEAQVIISKLPPSFQNAFDAHFTASPASARAVMTRTIGERPVRKPSYTPWVATAAILTAALWLGLRSQGTIAPSLPMPDVPDASVVGTSGTIAAPDLGRLMPRTLVSGTSILVPEHGVENRLLAFIASSRLADSTSWFDLDRLVFNTGSAALQPQSDDQLRAIAAILKTNSNVHVKIGGFTDNAGSAEDNLRLSEDRAGNVRAQLILLGVDPDQIEAEGYGEANPVASNATEAGRAANRRISMLVTQK